MFTGIVQSQAEIISATTVNGVMSLVVLGELTLIENLEQGASIAINGCCLTAIAYSEVEGKGEVKFDVIDETLMLTNLRHLSQGDSVNVERSLKIGDELGGHIVSGHIHCTAKLVDVTHSAENCCMTFELPIQWQKYVLEKGFITVNGISLTVGKVTENRFAVHLIPETLQRTNLNQLTNNAHVNIECDQQTITIVETIERIQRQQD